MRFDIHALIISLFLMFGLTTSIVIALREEKYISFFIFFLAGVYINYLYFAKPELNEEVKNG